MKTAFNVQAVKKMLDAKGIVAAVERAGKQYIKIWSEAGTFEEKLVKSLEEAQKFIDELSGGTKTDDGSGTKGDASDGTTNS